MSSCDVENRRAEQRPVRPTQQAPQNRWRRKHQHDVEGQDIEIDWLILEQKGLPDHYIGTVEKLRDIELVLVHRVVKPSCGASNLSCEEQKQENMGDVELRCARPKALGRS